MRRLAPIILIAFALNLLPGSAFAGIYEDLFQAIENDDT